MAAIQRIENETRATELGGRIHVADNPWTRFIGLIGRRGLAQGEGLHIVPCGSVHMFFMRFALDIIYLDREFRVVKTVSNLRTWRLSAARGAKTTLELPVGTIARTETVAGDQIVFQKL